MLPTPILAFAIVAAPSAPCTEVPVLEAGRVVGTICAESPSDLVVLDLSDDWAPRLLAGTRDLPVAYRPTFVALANERFGAGEDDETARRDRFHELFGIPAQAHDPVAVVHRRRHPAGVADRQP